MCSNVMRFVLQVVSNRDTQETLLCMACVFEVSNSEHGAQHHIYRLVKEWKPQPRLRRSNLFFFFPRTYQPQNKWQCLYMKVRPAVVAVSGEVSLSQVWFKCSFDCSCEIRYSCFYVLWEVSYFFNMFNRLWWWEEWPRQKTWLDWFGKWKYVLSSALCKLREKKDLAAAGGLYSKSWERFVCVCVFVTINNVDIQTCSRSK